jgi:hypothetical protein
MSSTKLEAAHRLIAHWVERVIDDADYALRIPLSAVLTEQNVGAVARLNLYADYEVMRRGKLFQKTDWDEHRGKEMLRAWLAPSGKAVRQ